MQATVGNGPGEVEVDHARADPHALADRIDVADPVEACRDDEESGFEGYGASGQAGTGAAGDDRDTVVTGDPHEGGHLACRLGEHGGNDVPRLYTCILGEDEEIERVVPHPVGPEGADQLVDQLHDPTLPDRSTMPFGCTTVMSAHPIRPHRG